MARKRKSVQPAPIEQDGQVRAAACKVIGSGLFYDEKKGEFDDRFVPARSDADVHTTPELMALLDRDKSVECAGIFIEANSKGQYRFKKIGSREKVIEAFREGNRRRTVRGLREAVDGFAYDNYGSGTPNAGLIGDDFVPLLGGPYNKQPYLTDYLRAHSWCFHEYQHHPFGRAVVHITRDFVLGRGYRIDSDNPVALAVWRAFEEVNDLQHMVDQMIVEQSAYGEIMIWFLPDGLTKIAFDVAPGQMPPRGLIPRIRLIDPSTVWEIVTYPEDITRVLYYQQVFPTQYQIYTARDGGAPVPTAKFIMQQIPAAQVRHFKINCMSNEKRGRSDLYPVLGYLKFMRDAVKYQLVGLQKQAAWAIDTTIEGSQADIDAYDQAVRNMGTVPPAGSEFVHTAKVKREYLSNKVGAEGSNETFNWCLNMIAASVQIPVNYFGTHLSGGSTRASALVATEPVAKKFQQRQKEIERVLRTLWKDVMKMNGLDAECEITFPEIIVQDRSAKIKDVKIAEDSAYITRKRAATIVAKELDLGEYDYDAEKAEIDAENPGPMLPNLINPLTAPASAPAGGDAPKPGDDKKEKPSAVTSADRRDLSMGMGA